MYVREPWDWHDRGRVSQYLQHGKEKASGFTVIARNKKLPGTGMEFFILPGF